MRILLCLLLSIRVLVAAEAPEHPLKPMLWKVEGKALAEPSWLFGTIHLGQGPIATLHPAAAKAFESADHIYTEIPMDPDTQLGLAAHFIRGDGKRLSESIGPALSKELDAELARINPQLDSTPFQSLKTWAVAVTIPMLELQLGGERPLDAIVWEKAEAAGKTTSAIETPADQFEIFDDLGEDEQTTLLAESLRMQREARKTGDDPLAGLIEAYIAGDAILVEHQVERQFAEMAEGEHRELGEKLLKRLLTDRNASMAETIAEKLAAMPGEVHFFAVGTGHYVGKANIRELLAEQGYTITRVSE